MLTNSGGIGRRWPRAWRALAAVGLAVTMLSSCSKSTEAESGPSSPTASPTASPQTTAPPPADPSPSWMSQFNGAQLARYQQALARWEAYSKQSVAIYRAGRDTPTAREVFREYDLQAVARIRSLAETYEGQGLRIARGPRPLSTKAVSVERTVVRIWQCNDYSRLLVTRNGKRASGFAPNHIVTPLIIEMDRPDGGDWMVAQVELKDRTSCAG